jgi:signal transduction histidine kinase
MYEDITERKQAEQERERMINELQAANARALEASRLKSEFLLNAVIGFSGILIEGMAGEIDEIARGMISGIYNSSHNLLGLINDVLDLSKIEAGRMELIVAPLSISELVEQWQGQMEVIATQKGLPFDVALAPDVPTKLYGDKDRIRQIVVNLLSNAFKFTEQGQVKLEVTWENEGLLIRVCDTGVGIPPHALNYIFDEFRQVDSSSQRQFGGTGLGLAIVRRLCVMMGGNIQVTSKLGEGSVFIVSLPLPTAA